MLTRKTIGLKSEESPGAVLDAHKSFHESKLSAVPDAVQLVEEFKKEVKRKELKAACNLVYVSVLVNLISTTPLLRS